MGIVKDIAGQRFGRLVAIRQALSPDEYARWLCRCDCGEHCIARGHTLRNGRTKSCGCLRREIGKTKSRSHGATSGGACTPEYSSYRKMRERCLNPNHEHYANYGGRGITICQRWLDSFEAFVADMGNRPSGTTLDRIDTNGNYDPENCRWATRKKQNRNTRVTRPVRRSDGTIYSCVGEAVEFNGGTVNGMRWACKQGREYQGFTWCWAPKHASEAA